MPDERILRLRQIAMPASDVERAVAFYRDTLGLRLIATFGPLAFFDLDGTRLLVERTGSDEPQGSVLYFGVDDIHGFREQLRAKGVEFIDEPHMIHRDDAGIFGPAGEEEWMTFFKDTEGNTLALSARVAGGR